MPGDTDTASTPSPAQTSKTSDPTPSAGSTDSDARAQAQAWLDAAVLPAGAVPAAASVAEFSSSQGWPCGPVAELEGFWLIPGTTVSETANWLQANPTGDLISTALLPVPDDPMIESAAVGYIPAEGAQEGIVYTIERISEGVAVHAQVAAQTDDASCPVLPDNGKYGEPGLG